MKVLGIIAEYNPFHNGHTYHLNKSKEMTKSDAVVVIMSGSFTQQGNIALIDKFMRSKIAIENGADLVIELPTIYANSSANYFAFGAINILNKLNIINSISFGSELGNISKLLDISNILANNENDIWDDISRQLKTGKSFAICRYDILSKYLPKKDLEILSKPNNTLGLEYLNCLIKSKSNITPYTITRDISNFNDTTLNTNHITSATSIRNSILETNNLDNIKRYVPENTFSSLNKYGKTLDNEDLFEILKYKILCDDICDLEQIQEMTEGLENKIKQSIVESYSFEDLLCNIKSKRYQMSKIKRLLINILLNISKDDFNNTYKNKTAYAHVLACSTVGKSLLSEISKNSDTPLITSINSKTMSLLDSNIKRCLDIDILASNIHSTLAKQELNKDYTNKL